MTAAAMTHAEELRARAFLRLLEWEGAKMRAGDRLLLCVPGLPCIPVSYAVSRYLYDYVDQGADGDYRLKEAYRAS